MCLLNQFHVNFYYKSISPYSKYFQVNGNMASYASIAASTKEPPQLLSPMVFTGQNQPQQPQKDLCNKSKPKSADLGKQPGKFMTIIFLNF